MAIQYNTEVTHWNYFLALEEDFGRVARFVEPCEANEGTYSIEFARLLMTATQETDVMLKALCNLLDSSAAASSINGYFKIISQHLPDLLNEPVNLPRYGLNSTPWSGWADHSPPLWWTANNKIKHERHLHFSQATLKNTYNSLAGLYVVIAYFYRQKIFSESGNARWQDVTMHMESRLDLFKLNPDYYYMTLAVP